MAITKEKISFVVQGKIDENKTEKCLKSIRRFFPGSKIILSTWENEKIDNLDYDTLVLNKTIDDNYDCFVENYYNNSKINNINRQIISTKAGLVHVETEYVFKTRTDFEFISDKIIEIYNQLLKVFIECDDKWRIFKQKILVMGVGNVNKMNLAYHVGDYLQLGLLDDVCKFWDIPLMPKEIAEFCTHNKIRVFPWFFNFKYACEQWIWMNNLEREKIAYNKPHIYYEKNQGIINDSEASFASNVFMIDYTALGIKTKFNWLEENNFAYGFKDYVKLYGVIIKSCGLAKIA